MSIDKNLLGTANAGLGIVADAYSQSKINLNALNQYQDDLSIIGTNYTGARNNNALLSALNANLLPEELSYQDLGRHTTGLSVFNVGKSALSGAMAGASFGPWGIIIGGLAGLGAGAIGEIGNNVNAKKAMESANYSRLLAADRNYLAFNNLVQNNMIDDLNLKLQHGLVAADGGAINIKSANKGKFTESAQRANMSVLLFAKYVLAHKDLYSSILIKRANFAKNAAGWNHADGGPLHIFAYGGDTKLSGDWSNGVTIIDEGGTHEENPNNGVLMGIAPDGSPNLVEEGEVIYKDYVFSNRLEILDDIRDKYKLDDSIKTYADVAKKLLKESAERPNDPISLDTLDILMTDLRQSLDNLKDKQELQEAKKIWNRLSPEEQEALITSAVPNNLLPIEMIQPLNNNIDLRQSLVAAPYNGLFGAKGGHLFGLGDPLEYYNFDYYEKLNRPKKIIIQDVPIILKLPDLTGDEIPANFYGDLNSSLVFNPAFSLSLPSTNMFTEKELADLSEVLVNGKLLPEKKVISPKFTDPVRLLTPVGSTLTSTDGDHVRRKLELNLDSDFNTNLLRYAPVIGSGLNTLSDLFGITNTPDYSQARAIRNAANTLQNVTPTVVGNYMTYNPVDPYYNSGRLAALARATADNIRNMSAGNRAAARNLAAINNSNYYSALGDLYLANRKYNDELLRAIMAYNLGIDLYNAGAIDAALALNAEIASKKALMYMQAAEAGLNAFNTANAARINNYNNLLSNLGLVGLEEAYRKLIDKYPWLLYNSNMERK